MEPTICTGAGIDGWQVGGELLPSEAMENCIRYLQVGLLFRWNANESTTIDLGKVIVAPSNGGDQGSRVVPREGKKIIVPMGRVTETGGKFSDAVEAHDVADGCRI